MRAAMLELEPATASRVVTEHLAWWLGVGPEPRPSLSFDALAPLGLGDRYGAALDAWGEHLAARHIARRYQTEGVRPLDVAREAEERTELRIMRDRGEL